MVPVLMMEEVETPWWSRLIERHTLKLSSKSTEILRQKRLLISRSPIGAGDTFIAGILYALNCKDKDWSLAQCVEFGIKVAGMKVFQEGFSGLDRALSPEL